VCVSTRVGQVPSASRPVHSRSGGMVLRIEIEHPPWPVWADATGCAIAVEESGYPLGICFFVSTIRAVRRRAFGHCFPPRRIRVRFDFCPAN
jgi:hypothetical protein